MVASIPAGRITAWDDYYEGLISRRTALAAYFTEWIECRTVGATALAGKDSGIFAAELRTSRKPTQLPVGEKGRLIRGILRAAEVAQADADKSKTLIWVQANTLPERERNAGQLLVGRRW